METILIVDDEAVVLQTAARLLGHEGYRVLPASGGSEALEVLKHAETSVDLALVDLTMPEMDGEEVFEALRAFVPGLPVVFMSGHSSEELARRIADKQGTAYLTKPFRREALREAVASLLEAEKGARAGR